MKVFKIFIILLSLLNILGCAKKFVNKSPIGQKFPSVKGQALDNNLYRILKDLRKKQAKKFKTNMGNRYFKLS